MTFSRIKFVTLFVCSLLVFSFPGYVNCASKKGTASGSPAPPPAPIEPEAVIEEVNAKQLEKLLTDKDYVAVFWYARSCVTCDKVLAELEKIDDDTDSFGVDFVKINDKRLAKQYGIKNFPALTYFREKEPIIYDGDLMDEEGVLDFLTSLEAMDLPDRIEEVNAKILLKIIEDTDFVAVLFYKPQCRKCAKALQELENIDDEADQLGIGFVKIHDEELADEYNLGNLPALVYYRHQTPIIYEGELSREEDVLEWLVQNKSTGDEDDVIEDVTAKTLGTLISNIDNLVVLFYDHANDDSMTVLEELEQIDDDCDKHGIQFVKIDDAKTAEDYGIETIPAIVYFEKQIPNIYDGDLMDEEQILHWLLGQLERDEIEDVTDEMLDKMVKEGRVMAVLFYDNNDKKSQKVLEELENIDDECDALGVTFVKIDNPEEAVEYGINKVPKLIYFEKGIPTIYEGNLEDEEKLLKWLEEQTKSDQIEDITDEMLDLIIDKMPYVAVLFYDKDQKKSQKILAELENIDDECDQNDIAFVKIDDDNEAKEWGIDEIPSIVLFERGIPHIYEGDLMKEDELLGWLVHQKRYSEIPEVTDEMKDKLVENTEHLAVIFYDKDDKQDIRILNELENIDDELEKEGIVIVRIDNGAEAKEYGLDHLPALIYFENKIPALYEGDLMNEEEVLEWLILQKKTATIEEVTDEILANLIKDHEYVLVFFTGPCEPGEKCENTLNALESIDDELDEAGIIFVTTEDTGTAKKHNIKSYPQLVFFRNRDPLIFTGDINDEDEVLAWITDEDTLEIPGKIEEVNVKMLDKMLSESENVVVFFYKEGDKKAQKILNELENIDDECEEKNINFVKTSDDNIDVEYDLPGLPALAFYRHQFRTIYTGDLMKEEAILEWVIDLHESTADVIESVDRKTLQVLINDVEHLAVFFYDDECESCPHILEELENIDDDTDKHGIQFVKSNDVKLAHEIGIFAFPALVYYETGVPIMYDGSDDDDDDDGDENNNGDDEDENDDDDDDDDDEENDDDDDENDDDDNDEDEENDIDDDDNDNDDDDGDDMNDDDDDDVDEDNENDREIIKKFKYEDVSLNKKEKLRQFKRSVMQQQRHIEDDDDEDDENDEDDEDDRKAAKKLKKLKRRVSRKLRKSRRHDDDEEKDVKSKKDIMRVRYENPLIHKKEKITMAKVKLSRRRQLDNDNEYENDNDDDNNDDNDDDDTDDDDNDDDDNDDDDEDENGEDDDDDEDENGDNDDENDEDEDEDEDDDDYENGEDEDEDEDEDDDENGEDEDEDEDKNDDDDNNENDDDEDENGDNDNEDDEDEDDENEEDDDENDNENGDEDEDENEDDNDDDDNNDDDNDDEEDDENDDEDENDQDEDEDDEDDENNGKDKDDDDNDDENDDENGDEDDEDDEDDDDDDDDDKDKEKDNRDSKKKKKSTSKKIYHLSELCAGNFKNKIDLKQSKKSSSTEEDDECFYVGLGHDGRSARRDKAPDDYKPFQCCPTKLEKSTKVPKMTAQRIGHTDDDSTSKGGNFKFATSTTSSSSSTRSNTKKSTSSAKSSSTNKKTTKKPTNKRAANDDDDDDDDHDDDDDDGGDDEPLVKVSYASPRKSTKKSEDKTATATSPKTKKSAAKDKEGDEKLNVKTGNIEDEQEVFHWILEQKADESIELIDRDTLNEYISTKDFLAVVFYKEEDPDSPRVLRHIELIDDEAAEYGIHIVKMNDKLMAKKYGYRNPPGITYFRKGKYINYDGDIDDEEEVLDWLTSPANMEMTDHIEQVNRKMFEKIRKTSDYLAVIFYSEECKQCPRVLAEVEHIDDDADKAGIDFVKIDDKQMAKEFGVFALPAIVFFKPTSKEPVIYAGDLYEEEQILTWLLTQKDPSGDVIEDLEGERLVSLIEESGAIAVYFWNKTQCDLCTSKAARKARLKKEKEQQQQEGGAGAAAAFGSDQEAAEGGEGATEETNKPSSSKHEDDADGCEQCTKVLEELENIDDDCDKHGITFVKTRDFSVADGYGVHEYPALVYFEGGIPNVFEGELNEEEEVLQWLITQKTEDRIELITRQMLETMVEETQYLAVYFLPPERQGKPPSYCRAFCSPLSFSEGNNTSAYRSKTFIKNYMSRKRKRFENQDKINCNICDQILEGLELIDDECDVFGIHMVKIQDPQLAKRYSIKTFPALVYFRNGNPLLFEGDLQNEQSVLEWLIDDDNRELADEIEEVNERMLDRLMAESTLLVVFFYDEDCAECEEILEELEEIDGEADMFGIDFVKIASVEAAKKYDVVNIPSLVYFRKQVPVLYDGDLHQHEKIITWLTSQDVFEIKNEIEEVNRKMLDKLLEENEFISVFFYEHNHPESAAALEKLENIDSETDNLDITFVKMADSRYAKKWGVTKLPAMVYFRRRFPSIYRGDLLSEDEVLEWLRKNRFRQPELNIFMYALIALGVGFVMYTAFLLQCFKPAPPPPVQHPKQT